MPWQTEFSLLRSSKKQETLEITISIVYSAWQHANTDCSSKQIEIIFAKQSKAAGLDDLLPELFLAMNWVVTSTYPKSLEI